MGIAQAVPISGVVLVTTPQDVALSDVAKALSMLQRLNVPVIGLVENMSYFQCPHCGTRSDIFGHGGARHEAQRLGVPFLGEVPLHMTIREKSDSGLPVVATEQQNGSGDADAPPVQLETAAVPSGEALAPGTTVSYARTRSYCFQINEGATWPSIPPRGFRRGLLLWR